MDFFEIMKKLQAGTITEAQAKTMLATLQTEAFNGAKKAAATKVEDKLGIEGLDNIKALILEAEELKTKYAGIQKEEEKYQVVINEQKAKLLEVQDAQKSELDKIKDREDNNLKLLRESNDKLLKYEIRDKVMPFISKIGLEPNPVIHNDFLDRLISTGLITGKVSENGEFVVSTKEITFKNGDEAEQSRTFSGLDLQEGIIKLYETDPNLKQIYKQVEVQKGGFGSKTNTPGIESGKNLDNVIGRKKAISDFVTDSLKV